MPEDSCQALSPEQRSDHQHLHAAEAKSGPVHRGELEHPESEKHEAKLFSQSKKHALGGFEEPDMEKLLERHAEEC